MTKKIICPHGCGKEWIGTSKRRAKRPLDPDATAVANQAVWNNCPRLTNADGTKRKLTMSNDDYFCRRVWMDAYLDALEKNKGKKKEPAEPDVDPKCLISSCETAILGVEVTNYEGKAVKDAIVTVVGIGAMRTDENGFADFGNLTPKTYEIKAEKDGYSQASDKQAGPAKTTKDVPPNETTVANLKLYPLPIILKENIIFIGSEEYYDSFWLKMIFIASGFYIGDQGLKLRKADKNTIAFVDVGYTKLEKLPLESLKDNRNFDILILSRSKDIVSYVNNRPEKQNERTEKTLIQDVAFFCHGLPGKLKLNYKGEISVDITDSELSSMKKDVFVSDGQIYSYACRTGISRNGEEFDSDDEARPENSLAQKMADHFKVDVYAFLTRSDYGEVLREKSDSLRISETLKKAREKRNGQVIDIPPDHEGLPHPGLAEGGFFSGTDEEGTDEYALWRKKGAIRIPNAGNTPKGLSRSMRRFSPRN